MAENEGKSHILGFLLQFEILSTTEFDFTYKKTAIFDEFWLKWLKLKEYSISW